MSYRLTQSNFLGLTALLCAAACGDDSGVPGNGGPADASRSVDAARADGSTSDAGSGDGGSGDGGVLACGFGQVAAAGSCTDAPYLTFDFTEASNDSGTRALATACFYNAGGIDNSAIIVSESDIGDCHVTVLGEGASNLNRRSLAGAELRIENATLGVVSMISRPGTDCLEGDIAPNQVNAFGPGEQTTFIGAAQAGVPAFQQTLAAPAGANVELEPGDDVVRGALYPVGWSGAAQGQKAKLVLSASTPNKNTTTVIACAVPDTGSFEISAAATELLPAPGTGQISIVRGSQVHLERSGVAIEIAIGASDLSSRSVVQP